MNNRFPRRVLTGSILSLLTLSTLAPVSSGADGTFTNVNGGDWNTAGNWASGTIADGAGFTANFNTLDITADRTVNLRANRTIGNLIFGDTATGTAGTWTIANSGSETFALTLAGTSPTITVNPLGTSKLAIINVPVSGTSGLTKEGTGILRLSQANTLSGSLVVNNGTLQLGNNSAINSVAAAITVNGNVALGPTGNVVLQLNDAITAGSGKTVTLNGTTDTSRAALFGGSGSNWQGNVILAGNGSNSIQAVSTGGTFTLSGSVSGGAGTSFALRGAGPGNVTGNINIPIPLNKTDGGTWTITSTGHSWTSTNILDGQITLGANNALPNVNLVLGQASATNGRFEMNGFSQTVPSLSTNTGSEGTNHIIRNSNLTNASTLTVNTATGVTDILFNTHIQGIGSLTLTKTGGGRFELQDIRTDNAAINVNEGTLAFTGIGDRHVRANIAGLAGASIEKTGTGTVDLYGGYNHAGVTTITSGRLNFSSGTTGSITVADGATLGAGLKGGSLTVNSVLFNGASTFAPILVENQATPLLNVTNLVTNAAGTAIIPEGADIKVGTYNLIQYAPGGTANFTLGAPGTYPHITASLVNNSATGRVDLNVTAVDSLVWTGATDGTWDVNGSSNFKLASNGAAATFYQGDSVLFQDGSMNSFITTSGNVRIGNLTFDNSFLTDYSINGNLSGPGGITKKNSGFVTLAGANSFTGPISVSDGVLVLGGANSDHGAVNITGGTLRFGHADAISSGAPVKISGGGTLDVAGFAPNIRIPEIRVSGAGVDGQGAIINTGTGITNNNHASVIILEGNTTWGGFGRYDISGVRFDGGTFTFTKAGTNETWWSPAAGSTLGPVIVEGGLFGIQGTNGINTSDTITATSAGTIGMFGNITVTRPMILNEGAIMSTGGGTPVVGGTVTLVVPDDAGFPRQRIGANGTNVINITGQITGPGGFEKFNTGTVQIQSATHNYQGNTLINSGTLNFSATGALPSTTNLIVNGGTFDPSNKTHTFASISGFGGTINQATAGTGRIETKQSTETTYEGQVNRVTIAMNGTGVLTLGGNGDNSSGIVEVNSGTVVLAKGNLTPVGYAVHSLGSGLTVNTGGTVRLDGVSDPAPAVTGVNVAPAGIDVPTYVDQIYNAVTINVNSGGTFDLNGRQEAINGLTQTTASGGTITNTALAPAKLYIGHQGASSLFAGVIQNGSAPVAIEKIGTGTQTLSGANTYTGATTITAGRLVVIGALGNTAVSVASGATLAGNGTIAGSVTVNGTLHSSNSIGAVTANNGAAINIGGPGGAATTVAATLNTNSFTLGSGGTRTLALDFDGTTIDRIISTTSGGLTLDGTNSVTVLFPNGGGWKSGNFPIFGYAGTLQGAGLSALTLTNPTGHNTVTFVNDTVNRLVQLQVVQNDAIWTGASSAIWDFSTPNWNIAAPPANVFLNGDNVVFNDTATATTVSIPANVAPTNVTFDNSTANYTLTGTAGITGTGSLVKKGTGTVTLGNPNTYTGNTIIQAGKMVLNYTTAVPLAPGSGINVAAGAELLAQHGGGDFTFGNSLSGAGTVVIDPQATAAAANRQVTVSGDNSAFTGTLRLSPTTGTFRVPVGAVSVLGGATVDVDAGAQIFVNAVNLTLANNFTISGTGYSETAGNLGAIRAANPTTFTGTITVDGSAKIGAHGGIANIAGTLTGGDLTFGGNASANISETMVLTGNASGLTSLVVNGGSTSGTATIALQVGDGSASGNLGSVPITLRSDAKSAQVRFRQGNDYVLSAPITSIGGTSFQADTLAGSSTGKGLVLTNVVNLNGGNFQVGTAAIANNAIAKLTIEEGAAVSAGTLNLGEQNSKQATVDQTGGTVSVASQMRVGHWPNETSTYNLSAGSLSITGAVGTTFPYSTAVSEQNGGIYIGIDGAGVVNHTGGTLSTNWIVLDNRGNSGAGTNMTGVDTYSLSGTGLLRINSSFGIISRNATAAVNLGGGTIEAVTGFNLDSDKITITANTILETNTNTITALATLGGTGGLTLNGGGTLLMADSPTAGFGGGSLGGNPVALGTGTTLKSDRSGTDTWSGNITGAGNLVKSNTGTLILTGANTYAGTTDITAGILEIIGSIGGSLVKVAEGGTLRGGGTVSTAVEINGTLAPGSGTGTLTVGGVTDFNDGSTFALTIDSAASFDKLIAAGITLDGTVNLSIGASFVPEVGSTFRIVDNTGIGAIGGSTGFFTWSGPEGVLTEGERFFVNGLQFEITYNGGTGNDVVLTTTIPEPGVAVSLMGGLTALLGLQRFRRRRAE